VEELDDVARGVQQQDLRPARAGDHVVAEVESRLAKPGDLGVEVVHDEMDAVSSRPDRAWSRRSSLDLPSSPAR
jgi:hypothetical protein